MHTAKPSCAKARAIAAPLNPAYKADEFTFYLTDLKAKALVVLAGMETPAREVAAAGSQWVWTCSPSPAVSGLIGAETRTRAASPIAPAGGRDNARANTPDRAWP